MSHTKHSQEFLLAGCAASLFAGALTAQSIPSKRPAGLDVVVLGDVDGDGSDDLAVGKGWQDAGAIDAGAVFVVRRSAFGGLGEAVRITTGEGGFETELARGDRFGASIAALGDLDGDGIPDLAVGVPGAEDGAWSNAGAVEILFLNRSGAVRAHERISAPQSEMWGARGERMRFGREIAWMGDIDGDGLGELAVAVSSPAGAPAGYVLSLDSDGRVSGQRWIAPLSGAFSSSSLEERFKNAFEQKGAALGLSGQISPAAIVQLTGSDPSADFVGDVLTGFRPLFVNFTDLSTGTNISSWDWDFGDNHSSSDQNPTHPFFSVQRFNVALTVSGDLGSDTELKEDYIQTMGGVGAIRYNGNDVNPEIYESITAPDFGTLWTSRVNGTSIGGTGLTFIFSFSDWLDPTMTQFGELLVDFSSTLFANSFATIDPTVGFAEHMLLIPSDTNIFGLAIYTQAFVNNTGNGTAAFTNALYVVLGIGS